MNNKDIKSLKRQLMAAVAMCLAAAVALGSSTYAWFVSNTKVTAEGMSVKATSEGGILIAYKPENSNSNLTYATTASASMTAAQGLYPISTPNTTNWYHASAANAGASDADANTYTQYTLTDENNDGVYTLQSSNDVTGYYVMKTFNIKSATKDKVAKNLAIDNVSVTVGEGTSSDVLSKALRVAVVVGSSSNPVFIAPLYTDATGLATNVRSGDKMTAITVNNSSQYSGDNKISTGYTSDIDASTGVDVKIFLYFEGEDKELFTNNINTMEDLNITIDFSATIADNS